MQKLPTTGQMPAPATPEDDGNDLDLAGLLRTLWRGKYVIAFFALIGGGWGWYDANLVQRPLYSATATLVVDVQMSPGADMNMFMWGMGRDSFEMNTEMEVIRSRALVEQVVDRYDLVSNPAFNPFIAPPVEDYSLRGLIRQGIGRVAGAEETEAAPSPTMHDQREATIGMVQGSISTLSVEMTYLFQISATSGDPDAAVLLANAFAETYRLDQIAQKAVAIEETTAWLSERTAELRREIDTRQAEIDALRAQNALTSDTGMSGLNTQLAEIENRRFDTERALANAESDLARITSAAEMDPAARAEAADDTQLAAMLPLIATGDAAAQLRFDRRYEQLLLQSRAERDRLAALAANLAAEAGAMTTQFAAATTAISEIRQMEQELESTRLLYETFQMRLKETTLQIGAQQADSRILNEATWAGQIAPRKSRIMMMALVLGVILGAGIVLLREILQNTYRTADDLERRTGLTVLGQVPRIPSRARAQTIAYLAEKPTSAAAEAIRNLRTSVLLSNIDNPPQVIMSTSSVPGEGKTTLALALAQNLAGLDKRVLLIEGDIRRRTFTRYFPDAVKNAGLLSVVSRKVPLAEAVWRHPDLNIDVLMGEKSAINAADVFSSASFRDLLADLRAQYDYIVIDTPPVLVVPDARVIGPLVDAVIYAVNWDKTTRTQVDEGLRQLRTVNVRVSGLVLSQIDPKGMRRYGYGNRYGAYSSYASGYYEN